MTGLSLHDGYDGLTSGLVRDDLELGLGPIAWGTLDWDASVADVDHATLPAKRMHRTRPHDVVTEGELTLEERAEGGLQRGVLLLTGTFVPQ